MDWEDVPAAKAASTDGWEDVPNGASSFHSGSAFKDTKELVPDLKGLWEQFKKEWANRSNTPMTPEIMTKMMQDEHSAGSAVLDTVGALPAMAAGGISGVASAVSNMDATKGLETGGKVMNALLPSTLLGNEADHDKEGYKASMAPLTAVMDTLNAVPQGYGEMVNAAGHTAAAQQLTDAGKLGIMAVIGTKGAIHMYKSITGQEASSVKDASDKLEALLKQREESVKAEADPSWEDVPVTRNGPRDRGIPPTEENPQGQLFSQEQDTPTNPISSENQLNLFPNSNDQETIPYTKEFPFSLEEPQAPQNQMGINMSEQESPLSLVPLDKSKDMTLGRTEPTAMQLAMEDAQRDSSFNQLDQQRNTQKQTEINAAYEARESAKQADYARMEAQNQLDFADKVKNIEDTNTHRLAFADRANVDHQFVEDVIGDRSTMTPEHTTAMVDSLSRGDLHGALDSIAQNHDSVLYRKLADYLKDKMDGIQVKMHDDGILQMGDRHATGYYDPATRTVGFSKVGAVSPHTVLHEMIHAVTSDFINARPNDLRVMGIKNLFNSLSGDISKEFPDIVNAKEFVAEAFSNPEFQEFLKDHRMNNRTVWQRFMDGVKTILGLRSHIRTNLSDALEHALDLGKQVMDAQGDSPLAQFKQAGIPSKLADLMATRPESPEPVNTRVGEDVQRLKIPGLEGPISDFTFYDKSIGEIVDMAKTAIDIPNTMMEKLSHQLQAGGLFESIKTRNPVVKYTFERITRATQEAAHNVKTYLTDPDTGLIPVMRKLSPAEKGGIHSAMMLVEGERELSSQELRNAGFNDKQIEYANKYRELSDRFFEDINKRRADLGMRPMDKRVAHIAGRFMGDFSRFVFNEKGEIVARIAGSTRGELNRASKYISEQHPEWQMGKREYNTLGKSSRPADRFTGLMEALNFITKTDSDAAKLFESYRSYMQQDAVNYLNATRHAKAKVKDAGGIMGSEGNKPWLDAIKNADEGMKAQVAYFEQGYSWMAMEKAVNDLKPLLGNEEVIKQVPNAVEWANAYKDHALGMNKGIVAQAANWTASKLGELSGLGHSNLFKATNTVKHITMQKFMGLLNIPFSITQLMQPFQVHPAMVQLLKGRGLEFSATNAQAKAASTFLRAISNGKMDAFEKQALAYADKMGILDVKMADHTKDINESKTWDMYHKIADINITIPERLTRGNAFLFYSHILKDAGIPEKDVFGAAENMTNMTMVNYHPIERPMGYAKLGWLGDLASTLTRYKHNQGSQIAFYTREGIHGGDVSAYRPMAAFLATSIAFGGVMGFFAFQEADATYQMLTKWLGKPDTLTNVVLSSGMPEAISHGVFSTLGLDMTTRFSNANLIPNSIPEALMPFGSAVLDVAQNTGRFIADPTSTTKRNQLIKSAAPQSVQGLLENKLFTEKQNDGSNLYINGTDGPNLGKGRVFRSEDNMWTHMDSKFPFVHPARDIGFRSLSESKELAKNYSDSQIEKANKDIVDGIVTKAKYDAMDGSLDQAKLNKYAQRAAKYGESPDSFVSKLVTWNQYRHLSQSQQQMLQNATGGFRGAVNIKEGR